MLPLCRMYQHVQVLIHMQLLLPKSPKGFTRDQGSRNDKTRDDTLSTASTRPPTNPGSSHGSSIVHHHHHHHPISERVVVVAVEVEGLIVPKEDIQVML